MRLKEKICKLNTVFQATGLIFIFININLQLKLINQSMLTEILIMKLNDKKHQRINCVFIRINPDERGLNILKTINEIYSHIKKSSKKSLINKISKILLELEFKSNHSINLINLNIMKKTLSMSFVFYQDDEAVKPLCIILPQINGYIKYFKNGGKTCLF